MRSRSFLAALLAVGLMPLLAGTSMAQEIAPSPKATQQTAVFAGGCFWCMVHPYDSLDGVVSVKSGYAGGEAPNPTYEQVSAGGTGYAEAVEIVYDPAKIGYDKLLDVFWHNIDPLAKDRQFCDVGHQYRSAVFPQDEAQQKTAEAAKATIATRFDQPVQTTIEPGATFYPAEDYHQDYYKKNPIRYKFYRWNCGRDQRLAEVWGKDAPAPAS